MRHISRIAIDYPKSHENLRISQFNFKSVFAVLIIRRERIGESRAREYEHGNKSARNSPLGDAPMDAVIVFLRSRSHTRV